MATIGNKRRMYLVTGSSAATYTWLAGEQSNNVNLQDGLVDISDKSTDWRQWLSGNKEGDISGSVFTDDSSSGPQKEFFDALSAGEAVTVFVGELGTSNTPSNGISASCFVSSISDANNNGAVATRDIQLKINGEPTFYNA